MRKGDGEGAVEMTEEISSNRAVATKIRSIRRGMVLFIPVANVF